MDFSVYNFLFDCSLCAIHRPPHFIRPEGQKRFRSYIRAPLKYAKARKMTTTRKARAHKGEKPLPKGIKNCKNGIKAIPCQQQHTHTNTPATMHERTLEADGQAIRVDKRAGHKQKPYKKLTDKQTNNKRQSQKLLGTTRQQNKLKARNFFATNKCL